ncbi:MAG: acyltransferase [Thermosynechococcaceae cyanobacterium]
MSQPSAVSIPLAPPDYPFIGASSYSIQFAIFYDRILPAASLSKSLEKVLADFYPVSGQLIIEYNRAYVQPQLDPVDLDVTEHSGEIQPSTALPSDLAAFFLEVKAEPDHPLARFCLHQFRNGSVLVVNMAHCLVDGYSFFYFLSSWAKACRGEPYRSPNHDRDKLLNVFKLDVSKNKDALLETSDFNVTFSQKTGLTIHEERQFPDIDAIAWDAFPLSHSSLTALKESCHPRPCSDNAVLCAYLWKQYGQLWHPDADPATELSLNCAIDFRRIYRKVIPLNYFGNAIKIATCRLALADLRHLSLADIAQRLNTMILGQRAGDIEQALANLEAYRETYGMKKMSNLYVSDPLAGLLVTNLSRIPLEELDFGQGTPISLVPLVPAKRVALLLPSNDGVMVTVAHP